MGGVGGVGDVGGVGVRVWVWHRPRPRRVSPHRAALHEARRPADVHPQRRQREGAGVGIWGGVGDVGGVGV